MNIKKFASYGLFIVLALISLSFSQKAQAAATPLAISIAAPVQFPSEEFMVTGARASALWGEHRHVYGIDVGILGNITSLNFVGSAVAGLANITYGQATVIGVQVAGLSNYNAKTASIWGLQLTPGINYNGASSSVNGFQIGLLGNISKFTTVNGMQIGLYNHAQVVNGFQIGLINVASTLRGIQIGLLNFHQQGTISVSPVINIGF